MANYPKWKSVLKVFAWLASLAGVVVLMGFIDAKRRSVKCTKVQILIPGADNFVEREEINAILAQGEGELVGRNLENIDIHQIEKTIEANPYIDFAKVYLDMNGIIYVKIRQRQPILRIINAGGQDYYVDSRGLKMPISPNFTANVLVATGNILEGFGGRVDTLQTPVGKSLYKVAYFAKKDTLWDAQIEQLTVNNRQDIELVPRVGIQRIILGNADSLATKFNNLLAFYKQAMPKVGWNAYKTINLKYSNQVVATRYDSLELKRINKPIALDTVMDAQRAVVSQAMANALASPVKQESKPRPEKSVKEEVVPAKTVEKTEAKPVLKKASLPVKEKHTGNESVEKEQKKTKSFAQKMAERMKAGEKELQKKEAKTKAKTN